MAIEQIRGFLDGSQGIDFRAGNRAEVYAFTEEVLVGQEYQCQGKRQRGWIRAFLGKATGLGAAQVTRLIRQYAETGQVRAAPSAGWRFPGKYTAADIALLAEVDRAHRRLSGPATRRILEREHGVYHRPGFERLAGISVSHLYNLRHGLGYRRQGVVWEPTRASAVSVAERRRPEPRGRPGHLRVDTVHQGDWDGNKGVYHINAVDTVTQWQVIGCASRISHEFLKPVLEAILHQFPFRILGFHSDNGSEFINHQVAGMLEKLRIDFTKSRACRSQDNALVEGKNGAVIRKHIGYGHIGGEHAEAVHKFYAAHLNPYLNWHRPCGYATVGYDQRGKRSRKYKLEDYMTPLEKLEEVEALLKDQGGDRTYLKEGVSMEQLKRRAGAISDTECAKAVSAAREILLRQCKVESPVPPPGW
ncbi:MAG: integrase [Verrucomicrobia bacterium]|nr:integrase [Verrucomicrobiota bacterium]